MAFDFGFLSFWQPILVACFFTFYSTDFFGITKVMYITSKQK